MNSSFQYEKYINFGRRRLYQYLTGVNYDEVSIQNRRNSSLQHYRDWGCLNVGGNLLTIILFTPKKKLRKKSLLLVINMAFADMMLGALSLPLFVYLRVGFQPPLWRPRCSTGTARDFFPLVWSHFLAGLFNFCSVYILWKILPHRLTGY